MGGCEKNGDNNVLSIGILWGTGYDAFNACNNNDKFNDNFNEKEFFDFSQKKIPVDDNINLVETLTRTNSAEECQDRE